MMSAQASLRPQGGAQFGVGGAGLGVAGQVSAVRPIGVGGGGDGAPGGADLLVGQGGVGGQAEHVERVTSVHGAAPGPNRSSKLAGWDWVWREGLGPGTGVAGTGAPMRVSGEGRGRATWTKVAVPWVM